MSVALKRLADADTLTEGALSGTERLLADDGAADGFVTVQQVADRAVADVGAVVHKFFAGENGWGVGTDPNGIVTANRGDMGFDFSTGQTWTKTTDGTNTGWI